MKWQSHNLIAEPLLSHIWIIYAHSICSVSTHIDTHLLPRAYLHTFPTLSSVPPFPPPPSPNTHLPHLTSDTTHQTHTQHIQMHNTYIPILITSHINTENIHTHTNTQHDTIHLGMILHSPILSGIRVLTASRLLSCWDIYPNIDRIRDVKCFVFIIHGIVRKQLLDIIEYSWSHNNFFDYYCNNHNNNDKCNKIRCS